MKLMFNCRNIYFNNFIKFRQCTEGCRRCNKSNKKLLLFKSPVDNTNYMCFTNFLRTYILYQKVKRKVDKMSDEEIVNLIDSTLSTLNHEVVKQEWRDAGIDI